jgi:transcriptional regulator with XRE-family HTH domain
VPLLRNKLKDLRGSRSTYDVEKGTGIKRAEINTYEKGGYYPSAANLKKLAHYFDVTYSELRKLYYAETITDPEEQEAIKSWVLEFLMDKD